MRKWVGVLLALMLLTIFPFGCAEGNKTTRVKCPKCGTIFTIDEDTEGLRTGLPKAPKW